MRHCIIAVSLHVFDHCLSMNTRSDEVRILWECLAFADRAREVSQIGDFFFFFMFFFHFVL